MRSLGVWNQGGCRVKFCHGFVRTPMVEGPFPEEALHALESEHALNRLARPAEIANAVAFLLSDEASFISGSYHPVDAGYTAR